MNEPQHAEAAGGNRLRHIFAGPTARLHIQFIRYVVVGAVATAVDFATLMLLVEAAGIHYLLANACGFTTGLVTNYLLSVRWVFSCRTAESRMAEFLIFAAVGVVGLGISEGCMYLGVDIFGLDYRAAKAASVVCTLVWNFAVRRLLLFRRRAPRGRVA